ncbi:MAG: RhoGEF domain-containing protein, partial [archaeon]|nr:RhoGEF domain-containing protein [archaeon]
MIDQASMSSHRKPVDEDDDDEEDDDVDEVDDSDDDSDDDAAFFTEPITPLDGPPLSSAPTFVVTPAKPAAETLSSSSSSSSSESSSESSSSDDGDTQFFTDNAPAVTKPATPQQTPPPPQRPPPALPAGSPLASPAASPLPSPASPSAARSPAPRPPAPRSPLPPTPEGGKEKPGSEEKGSPLSGRSPGSPAKRISRSSKKSATLGSPLLPRNASAGSWGLTGVVSSLHSSLAESGVESARQRMERLRLESPQPRSLSPAPSPSRDSDSTSSSSSSAPLSDSASSLHHLQTTSSVPSLPTWTSSSSSSIITITPSSSSVPSSSSFSSSSSPSTPSLLSPDPSSSSPAGSPLIGQRLRRPASAIETESPVVLAKLSKHRFQAVMELYNTEKDYLRDISTMTLLFRQPILSQQLMSPAEATTVFSNLTVLQGVAKQLIADLSPVVLPPQKPTTPGAPPAARPPFAPVFLKFADILKVYSFYCNGQLDAFQTVELCRKKYTLFAKFLDDQLANPDAQGLPLISYLIKPTQRICKYPLLIREILKHTPDAHPDNQPLREALAKIEEIVSSINESSRTAESFREIVKIQTRLIDGD